MFLFKVDYVEKRERQQGKGEKRKGWWQKKMTSERTEGTQVLQWLAELKEIGEGGSLHISEKQSNGVMRSGWERSCLWREGMSGWRRWCNQERGDKCLRLLLTALPVVTSLGHTGPLHSWILSVWDVLPRLSPALAGGSVALITN